MVGKSREVVGGGDLRTESWSLIGKSLILYANEYELVHVNIGKPLIYFL